MKEIKTSARNSTSSIEKNIDRRKSSKETSKVSTKKPSKKNTKSNKIKKIKIGKYNIKVSYIYVATAIVLTIFGVMMYGVIFSQYRKPVTKMLKATCKKTNYESAFSKDIADILKKADKQDKSVNKILHMYSDFYEEDMEEIGYEVLDKSPIRKDKLLKAERDVNNFVKMQGNGKGKDIVISEGYIMATKVKYKSNDIENSTYMVISVYKMNDSWGIWYNE